MMYFMPNMQKKTSITHIFEIFKHIIPYKKNKETRIFAFTYIFIFNPKTKKIPNFKTHGF